MSIIIKGLDMPKGCKECMSECINIPLECYPDGDTVPNCPLIEIPIPHGRLVEEYYPGELKAKQPEGIFILYRSADEDTDRFVLEAED